MLAGIRKLFQRSAARSAPRASTPIPPADWRRQGNEALGRGDLESAARWYRTGTTPPPGDAVAWLNLAYVQLELQQHASARESLQRAESLLSPAAPELPDVWALIGRERQESKDWDAAAMAYARVVEKVPMHDLVWRELGQVHELAGRNLEAEAAYRRAVAIRPDFELAMRDLSRLLLRLHRPIEALPMIERCLQLPHAHPEAHLLSASALGQTKPLTRGLDAADHILAQGYDEWAAVVRGRILIGLQRPLEALASYSEVLRRNPTCYEALMDSAGALALLGRCDEALKHLDRAEALRGRQMETARARVAAHLSRLQCDDALALVENDLPAELGADPEFQFLASFLWLLVGDYERGWPAYESRWRVHRGVGHRKPDFGAPEWRGEALEDGSVLLYCEQGLGDSIQALRYVPLVAQRARKVWLSLQRPLWPLVEHLRDRCELIAPDMPAPAVDFACPLMGLPAVFGTRVDSVPTDVPYVHVSPERVAHWETRLGPRTRPLRVGVVWSGNAAQSNDYNRSMSLSVLRAAVRPDVEYIALQKDIRESDRTVLAEWDQLRWFGEELETFADTAALASLVDVVISVCTSVAHLAGALGRPLSVVLTYSADWRWLLDREDSPWYPTAKLYRQQTPGDWGPPLARAMAELEQRAALTTPAST